MLQNTMHVVGIDHNASEFYEKHNFKVSLSSYIHIDRHTKSTCVCMHTQGVERHIHT